MVRYQPQENQSPIAFRTSPHISRPAPAMGLVDPQLQPPVILPSLGNSHTHQWATSAPQKTQPCNLQTQPTQQQDSTCSGTCWAPTLPTIRQTLLWDTLDTTASCQEPAPSTSVPLTLGPLGPAAGPWDPALPTSGPALGPGTWFHPSVSGHQPGDILDPNSNHQ